MYKLFSFFLITFSFTLEALTLKEQLAQGQKNSWIVTEQCKNFTFFYIKDINTETVTIEEVTMPVACLKNHQGSFSWKQWFEEGAPGHTLWTTSQINLKTGVFENSFSYTHQSWLNVLESSSFMTTLLNLDFEPVPDQERKRIGLAPPARQIDNRPFWGPRLMVEGQRIPNASFSVWQARWPNDRSELSRKRIEVYLPDNSLQSYPTHFPYWLEIEGKIGSARVRIVDSGMQAMSPMAYI